MYTATKNTTRLFALAVLILAALVLPVDAQSWEDGLPVRISYQELEGVDAGYAEIKLLMTIPVGTPLLARESAIGGALSVLHDIWGLESVQEEAVPFLGPVVPMDVQYAVSEISGAEFIIEVMDAFETVSDAGYSRFQRETTVSSVELIPIERTRIPPSYPDPPRFFAWIIGEDRAVGSTGHENWVIASLVNYSASILSFRSELGRFPNSFAELRETRHLLIEPLNPYTSEPVRQVATASPGDLTYQYVDTNRVVLLAYIRVGNRTEVVTREINVPSSGAYDLLYRQTAGLGETDREVARYVFQIHQILNEYYYEHLDLPYGVPQCEAEGFAYVSFMNPYTDDDAQQAGSLADIRPGDYTYYRISSTSYFLVGYGASGVEVLSVSPDFGHPGPAPGVLSVQ